MIIVLKGADFSANNLGKVKVTTGASTEVKALLSNYSKTFTKSQENAVDIFISTLRENSLWNKITNLYIPILGTDMNDAMINSITAYNNSSAENDTTLDGAATVVSNKGIQITTQKNILNKGFTCDISTEDFHYLVYLANDVTEIGWQSGLAMFNVNGEVKKIQTNASTAQIDYNFLDVKKGAFSLNDDSWKKRGLYGFSSGNTDSVLLNPVKASDATPIKTSTTFFTTETSYSNVILDPFTIGTATSHTTKTSDAKISIISVGKALSASEMAIYKAAMDELVDALNPVTTA